MSVLKSEGFPVDHSLLRDDDSVLFMVILGFIWFSQHLVIPSITLPRRLSEVARLIRGATYPSV